MNDYDFELKRQKFVEEYCKSHPNDPKAVGHGNLAFIRSEILGVAK